MSYTVWLDGMKIGSTTLEISLGDDRRAGVFHPTAPGLALLPRVTAMAPALLDARRACREQGIDTEDPDLDLDATTDDLFRTPEGQRVLEAAKIMTRVELHGPRGELVPWESLLISDMQEIMKYAASAGGKAGEKPADGDALRYLISAKIGGAARHPSVRVSRARALS